MKKTNKLNKPVKTPVEKDIAHTLALFNRKKAKVTIKIPFKTENLTEEDLTSIPEDNDNF